MHEQSTGQPLRFLSESDLALLKTDRLRFLRGLNDMGAPAIERAARRSVEVGDCWEWQGALDHNNQPVMRIPGKTAITVRRQIALESGKKVDGRWVMSGCGNHRCVNPEHFVIVPRLTGIKRIAKIGGAKTSQRLLNNYDKRVLTDEQAMEALISTDSQKAIAERFGVSEKVIWRIKKGLGYKQFQQANPWSGLL